MNQATTPIDLSVLIRMVGDDLADQRRWLNKFLDRARTTVAEIDAAHALGETPRVGELGHRLKSPARSVGALALGELCQALEEAGKAGDGELVETLIPRLGPLVAELSRFTADL